MPRPRDSVPPQPPGANSALAWCSGPRPPREPRQAHEPLSALPSARPKSRQQPHPECRAPQPADQARRKRRMTPPTNPAPPTSAQRAATNHPSPTPKTNGTSPPSHHPPPPRRPTTHSKADVATVCDDVLQAGQTHKAVPGVDDSMEVCPAHLDDWGHHVNEQADGINQTLEQMRAQHASTCTTAAPGLRLDSRMTAAQGGPHTPG